MHSPRVLFLDEPTIGLDLASLQGVILLALAGFVDMPYDPGACPRCSSWGSCWHWA